jgi:hypothetical protein
VDWQARPGIHVGVEVNFAVRELGFRGTWVVQSETETRPMAHLNTSSDRIGTPKGFQQYSATIGKALRGTPFAAYASVTYSEFDRGIVLPFGIGWQATPNLSAIFMIDGKRSHALATYAREDHYVQLGWIWLRRASITVGWGF